MNFNVTIDVLTSVVAPMLAGIVIVVGNHIQQRRLNIRIREVDETKRRLYELLELASEYWSGSLNSANRNIYEAKIISLSHVVSSEMNELKRHTKKLKHWHKESESDRLKLFHYVSGGCFQQSDWKEDPQRILQAARTINSIIQSLNKAY